MQSVGRIFLVCMLVLFATTQATHSECLPSLVFNGEGPEDRFGSSVASAGDVNNDGYLDFIFGAPANINPGIDAGKAYVFSGFDGDTLYVFNGEFAGDEFGFSVASAGDVNNDGHADIIIGARNGGGEFHPGLAYVFSGIDGDTLYLFAGETDFDLFGCSVAGAVDINKDGFDDMIVGASSYGFLGEFPGKAYLFSGKDGSTLREFTGEADGDSFGAQVAFAGDVNSDGNFDLIVGAQHNDEGDINAGRAYVFSGRNGSTIHIFTGNQSSESLGASVASAGDINYDGYADLLVGAPNNDNNNGHGSGRAYVYSGLSGSPLFTIDGEAALDDFGFSVASAGDVNNDGNLDIFVGAHNINSNGDDAGRAYVFSGLNRDTLLVFTGESFGHGFSFSVAPAGDLNHDGFDDLLVGSRSAGRAYVFISNSCGDVNGDGLVSQADVDFLSSFYFSFGESLCNHGGDASDVNGDGSTDIADIVYIANFLNNNGPTPCVGSQPPPGFDQKKEPEQQEAGTIEH